ncbi:CC0125/CC1285 family lipoprotein [Terricaulis sp.]|uniref:CC0125/CC1285 family lipoprotein n=1 Tax=Terricaulis sp. TaxID=2768686 RepID=UPI0037833E21
MRTLKIAAIAVLFATAANAETITPYQPAAASRSHYGYAETQLDWNRVRVSFSGAPGADLESVESALLYRAAETTLQRGFDYFAVVDHDVDTTTEFAAAGPPAPPLLPPRRYREINRHESVSEILMYHGVRPEGRANVYDARFVTSRLAGRVR